MKLQTLAAALLGLTTTTTTAFQLDFYIGSNCRSAHLGRFDSFFHVCGTPPVNSASVVISNNIPEDSARQVHFYRHPSYAGCSGSSVVVARSGCINFSGGTPKGWQTQHLGTPGRRDANETVVAVEFEA